MSESFDTILTNQLKFYSNLKFSDKNVFIQRKGLCWAFLQAGPVFTAGDWAQSQCCQADAHHSVL